MKKTILVTGGCGFIGHHFVEHIIKNTQNDIVIFDRLSYASNGFDRLRDIDVVGDMDMSKGRIRFFAVDFTRPISIGVIKETAKVTHIVHMGAETHVDNSILDPVSFFQANVMGTVNMLQYARQLGDIRRTMRCSAPVFVYFSTDEVFGPAPEGHAFKEWDRYNCTNPYSASKAGGEQAVLAFLKSYQKEGMIGFITHTMNVFGERQHPEKFIPLCCRKILNFEKVFIHGTPDCQKSGSRFYIHARNVAAAIIFLLDNFCNRDIYNIVGERELTNLELAQKIAKILDRPLDYEIVNFHESRPGHDLRYALDGSKLAHMGFKLPKTIDESLEKTVNWTLTHPQWMYLD